jgi:fumarate hydratase class I
MVGFFLQDYAVSVHTTKRVHLPLKKKDVLSLHIGDIVMISGRLVTGRDRVHKFLFHKKPVAGQIPFNLEGTILYHCGPIMQKTLAGHSFIAGGPTTSMRVEMYEYRIISEYGLRGVMGKGGMGKRTLDALRENRCVYLHTIGGAAAYLADRVKKVAGVWMIDEFGPTEAMWALDVEDFPAIVTMDAYGKSLHDLIAEQSFKELRKVIQ